MSVRRLHLGLVFGTFALPVLLVAGCNQDTSSSAGPADGQSAPTLGKVTTRVATSAEVSALPARGKQKLSAPPAVAVFGMIYIDANTGKEYIFDGNSWVPHDNTVDSFYAARKAESAAKTGAKTTASMVQSDVYADGDPACTSSGAHGGPGSTPAGHYAYGCAVCHKVGGRVSFLKTGPAYASGLAAPTYNTTTQTCSNVACHVVSGSFSYYTYDWGLETTVLTTITYGSSTPRPTASWFSTGAAGCTACHDDPPRNGSTGSNVWHSGNHGGQGPTGANNQCQLCHPDASSPGNGIGDTITNKALHANGTANVSAVFTSACYGCH